MMSARQSGREVMLGRIRAALADVVDGEPAAWEPDSESDRAATYTRAATGAELEDLPQLFAERCGEYKAIVTRCGGARAAIAEAIAAACSRQDVRSLVAAPDLEGGWAPPGVELRADEPPLSVEELDAAPGVLTASALAIALTGTIVLDGGPGQGRRALTLVPDLHICVVIADQIVHGVPEAVRALAPAPGDQHRPLTLISGPSATSDIELERVEGVHGPRRLEVVVAG